MPPKKAVAKPKSVCPKAAPPQEANRVRSCRDYDVGLQVELVPQEGRVFLDTVTRNDKEVQVITDVALFHQQVLSGQSSAEELMFDDDGHGALVMDDGSVVMLQQWFAKQLWRDKDGAQYIKDVSNPMKPSLKPWTVELQKYAKKDVKMAVGDKQLEFETYVVNVRRGGGCSCLWKAQCFFTAFNVKGYGAEGSKWLYDRWKVWESAVAAAWPGHHLFKSMVSKNKAEVASSGTLFLPNAALSTCAVMVITHRLAFEKPKSGGLSSADTDDASAVFHAFVNSAFGDAFKIKIDFVHEWAWKFPRPQDDAGFTLLLEVSPEGMLNVQPLLEAGGNEHDGTPEEKELLHMWLSMITPIQQNGIVSVCSLLTEDTQSHARLNRCHWASFWRQILVPLIFRIEKKIKGTSASDDGSEGIMCVTDCAFDDEGGWSLREVDAVCRHHVANSISASKHECLHVSFALDKVAGARGNQLQNGFAVLQSGIAFELVPQVLV